MQFINPADPDALSLDQLRRIQRTLLRRASSHGDHPLLGVGFGPPGSGARLDQGLTARFLVRRRPAESAAIQPTTGIESIRLKDRSAGRYRVLRLPTEMVQAGDPRPVGTAVRSGTRRATSAAVVRWTTLTPPPDDPPTQEPDDPRWRWGLLCVAHLLAGRDREEVQIERLDVCGDQPTTIEGRVVAAGRLPGGPDAAVLETGLDRLWLSGLLPDPAAASLPIASDHDLLHWIRHGTRGYAHQDGRLVRWRLQMYLPQQTIRGLGRLRHVIRFTTETAAAADAFPAAAGGRGEIASETGAAFGPGTSGSILVAAGAPLGMQVAAEAPLYQCAYAQLFQATAAWLRSATGASRASLVRVF